MHSMMGNQHPVTPISDSRKKSCRLKVVKTIPGQKPKDIKRGKNEKNEKIREKEEKKRTGYPATESEHDEIIQRFLRQGCGQRRTYLDANSTSLVITKPQNAYLILNNPQTKQTTTCYKDGLLNYLVQLFHSTQAGQIYIQRRLSITACRNERKGS